jgi:hypothetical protein
LLEKIISRLSHPFILQLKVGDFGSSFHSAPTPAHHLPNSDFFNRFCQKLPQNNPELFFLEKYVFPFLQRKLHEILPFYKKSPYFQYYKIENETLLPNHFVFFLA